MVSHYRFDHRAPQPCAPCGVAPGACARPRGLNGVQRAHALSVVASALAALLVAPATGHAQAASVEIQVPEVRVEAQTPPPAARVEVQPAPPAPGHVWLAGHWRWEHGAYVWVPGHWARPPAQGYVWVPAEWAQRGGVWYFREGHWKAPPPAGVYTPPPAAAVTGQQAPPAAVAEAQPAPPSNGAVWIPGYWAWTGSRYVWVAGTWSSPRPGFVWVPSHWKGGTPYGWKWVQGHWRRV